MLPVATSSTKLIVCAAKLPVLSRLTNVFGVFRFVPVAPTALSTYAFVAASVALVTVPEIVISLTLKLPDASRATIAFAVFALVAEVAEFATLPAVEMVANFESVIPADELISLFTINELDKLPDASLCTTPALMNASIEIVPPEDIFNCSAPEVLNDNAPALADKPVV